MNTRRGLRSWRSQQEGNLLLTYVCWAQTSEERGCHLLALLLASASLLQSPPCLATAERAKRFSLRRTPPEWICKHIFIATVTEQPDRSSESGCFVFVCFFCFWVGNKLLSRVRQESGKDTERASVQLWGVPSSTKLLQPPPLSPSSSSFWTVCERERHCGRVRESRLQASGEETSGGGSTQGKKNLSLSSAASFCTSYGQRRAKEESGWRIPSLRFPAVSEAVAECGWSAGRAAAESSTSDFAPQQKTSTSEEPGCLTTWPTRRRGTAERKARVSDGMRQAVAHTCVYADITMQGYCTSAHSTPNLVK